MTQRTESNPPSQIEVATTQVIQGLNDAITRAHADHATKISELQFRHILAGYFHNKSLIDWAQDLGSQPTESDRAASRRGEY